MSNAIVTAQIVVDLLSAGSGPILNVNDVIDILASDVAVTGSKFPTVKECEDLVYGDEDGIVPQELQQRYPDLSAFLAAQS